MCEGYQLIVTLLILLNLIILPGCASMVEIRIENKSVKNYNYVIIGDTFFGHINSGEVSEFQPVILNFKYTHLKLLIDGKKITG
jgi:hypothetical protein